MTNGYENLENISRIHNERRAQQEHIRARQDANHDELQRTLGLGRHASTPTYKPAPFPASSSSNSWDTWSKPTSTPSSPSGGGGAGGVSDEDIGAGIAFVFGGIAVIAAAAVYIPYKISEFILNKINKKDNNQLGAAAITASLYTVLGSLYYAAEKYEDHIRETYPSISVFMDKNRNFYSSISPDPVAAFNEARNKCPTGLFDSCLEVASIPAGEKACISYAMSNTKIGAYKNIFNGDYDFLSGENNLCILSLEAGEGYGDSFCDIGPIEYICNSHEMNDVVSRLKKTNSENDNTIAEFINTHRLPLKPNPVSQPAEKSEPAKSEAARPVEVPVVPADVQPASVVALEPFKVASGRYYLVTADQLNLRQGPGTAHETKGALIKGSCVKGIGTARNKDGFAQVLTETVDKEFKKGFVSEKYLAPAAEGTNHKNCRATFNPG